MAHEIGHVLLGYDGHASEGLMKATWSVAEQYEMPYRLMRFTADQSERLRRALDGHPVVLAASR